MIAAEWSIQPTWMMPKLQMSLGESLFKKYLEKCPNYSLRVTFPSGETMNFGSGKGNPAELVISDPRIFIALLWSGDIGLGEAFVENYWDSPNPTAVLEFFSVNQIHNDDKGWAMSWLGDAAHRYIHRKRANSIEGSKRNISAHYDLSNEMYEEFLDPKMQYSSAVWADPQHTLAEAQENKMRKLLDSLELEAGMSLLEVGSGWGYLARMAAQDYGVEVTSVTLSEEQLKYARKHVEIAGLSHKIDFRLQDYREVEGQFDRIVSVEMIEAVGYENLQTYFKTLEGNLKEDGKIAIQVITVTDQKFENYVKDCDWIQKYIFPGALCPSIGAIVETMSESSRLWIESTQNYGIHYARTLNEWRQNFESNWENVQKLGFDQKFRRLWNYYMVYCEAGYRSGVLGLHQMVLSKSSRRLQVEY